MTEQSLGGIEGPSKTTQPVGRARAWLAVRLPAPETGFVSPQQRREQTRPLCGLYLHPSAMLRFSCTCAIRALVQGGNAMTHCTWNCGQSVRHTAACAVGGMPPRVPGARASGPSPSPLHSLPLVSLPPPRSVSPSFPPPSLSLSLFPLPSLPLSCSFTLSTPGKIALPATAKVQDHCLPTAAGFITVRTSPADGEPRATGADVLLWGRLRCPGPGRALSVAATSLWEWQVMCQESSSPPR